MKRLSGICALSLSMLMSVSAVFSGSAHIVKAEEAQTINGEEVLSEETVSIEEIVQDSEESVFGADTAAFIKDTADTEMATVIVELEDPCVIDAGLEPGTAEALSYAEGLLADQAAVESSLYEELTTGASALGTDTSAVFDSLNVSARYTNVMNGFAVDVPRDSIALLKELPGVVNVFKSVTYTLPDIQEGYEPDMMTSGDMIGINQIYSSGYQGEGMVIGILDTGLDTAHSAFANAPSVQKITSKTSFSGLNARSTYKSAKVPFAYDYADGDTNVIGKESHGTHVAGTIAGNNDVITGIAPEAQLAIFKVFSDSSSGAQDSWIINALEDVVIVKPDVINMSLGSPAGDDGTGETGTFGNETLSMQEIYQRVYDAGVLLSISAGNESYTGASNGYPKASNPNIGIVGSPSTYPASLSVASIENTRMMTDYFVVNGEKYSYSDTAESASALFTTLSSYAPMEYVDCGLGAAEDFAGVDVSGKIALIQRGGLAFTEKQANAKNAGALGAVIYNNAEGTINMSIDSSSIPCVSITKADGEKLLASESRMISEIGSGESFENANAYQMSDFSSWGTTDDLSVKPEVTAPGGHIYSSVIGGGYADYSGTSMAAPHASGVMALVRQYAKNAGLASSSADLNRIVNQLIMSTAHPVAYPGTDGYYSPRNAGAGLVNINDAMAAHAYLSVDGTEDSRPKIELGDDPYKTGRYVLSFNVTNISDTEMTYSISPVVQADYVSDGLDTLSPVLLDYISEGISSVTVPANTTVQAEVTVILSESARSYLDSHFENGGFVEGYVILDPETAGEDATQLSLPFVGFYGNWSDLPLFDASVLNASDAAVGINGPFDYESYAELDTDNGHYDAKLVGMNAYDPSYEYFSDVNPAYMTVSSLQNATLKNYVSSVGEDVLVFDRTKNTGLLYFSAAVTRNADWVRFRVYNTASGTVYFDDGGTDETIYKNYEPSYYALWNPLYIGWAATDANGNALPEGTECTLEIQLSNDGGSTVQTMTLPIRIDNSKPYIVGTSQSSSDNTQNYTGAVLATTSTGRKYLKFKASDNQYLAAAQAGTAVSSTSERPWSTSSNYTLRRISYTYSYLSNVKDTQVFYGDAAGQECEVVLDVTDISGSTYYVGLYDYTRLKTFYKVSVGSQKEYSLNIDPAESKFVSGQQITQQYTVSDESGFAVGNESLIWSVSGNHSGETAVDAEGLLSISADETSPELTVRAELAADTSLYAEASVILEQPVREYTVEASASEGGTITPEGALTYKEGETAEFTVTPDVGYEIDQVTVNGEIAEVKNGKLSVVIEGDTEVYAAFRKAIQKFTAEILPETELKEGVPTVLKAEAVNGKEPYRYKFTVRIDGVWHTIREFSSENETVWIPQTGGNLTVNVTVRDASGAQVKSQKNVSVEHVITEELSAEISLPAEAFSSEPAVITAAAKGGAEPHQYRFTARVDGKWMTIQNFSKSDSCTWTPEKAGTYAINVTVLDAAGNQVKSQKNLVVSDAAAGALDLIAEAETEVGIGETVTLKGTGTGGRSPYQYKFTYKEDDKWKTLQGYSSDNTAEISFSTAGKHNTTVYVKDANGNVVKKLIVIYVTE